ncbi:Uncharacterized protein APZ42_026533, partial [Daphnia magna]
FEKLLYPKFACGRLTELKKLLYVKIKSSQLGNVCFSGWEGSRFSRRRVDYWKCFHAITAFRDGFVENKVPSTCQGESLIEAYANTTWRDFDKNMMKQLRGSTCGIFCTVKVMFELS